MQKEVIWESDDATLWLYPQEGILHHQFRNGANGETFRMVLLEGLKVIKQGRASKWLSDDREAGQLSADDAAWSQDFFGKQAVNVGWKYWAMLLPKGGRAKITTNRLVNQEDVLVSQIFEDEQAALEWLKSCE